MANERTNPNDVRDIETDERGRLNPNREDIAGRADEGDADPEEFEDVDDPDDEDDLGA